jgi:hypothetical protein
MSQESVPAQQRRRRPQPIPVAVLLAIVVGELTAMVTGGLLLLVYVLNHGVNPAWIIFLTSSLRHWEAPLR